MLASVNCRGPYTWSWRLSLDSHELKFPVLHVNGPPRFTVANVLAYMNGLGENQDLSDEDKNSGKFYLKIYWVGGGGGTVLPNGVKVAV